MSTTSDVLVDPLALRDRVREEYRAVATNPAGPFHGHTGRDLARRLGYGADVVSAALRDIDLWTGWTAGGLPGEGGPQILTDIGFTEVANGEPVDTVGGATGEENARTYEVYGCPLLARNPR